ncbi:MAG: hypothetical protein ACE5EK_04965, partial [Nitrospinales bacterium]
DPHDATSNFVVRKITAIRNKTKEENSILPHANQRMHPQDILRGHCFEFSWLFQIPEKNHPVGRTWNRGYLAIRDMQRSRCHKTFSFSPDSG